MVSQHYKSEVTIWYCGIGISVFDWKDNAWSNFNTPMQWSENWRFHKSVNLIIYLIIFLHTVCRLKVADMSIHFSKHWNVVRNIYVEGDLHFQQSGRPPACYKWPTILAINCGKRKKIKLSVPLSITSMLVNYLWLHSICNISQTTLVLWEGKF